jgi:hypothetical protein
VSDADAVSWAVETCLEVTAYAVSANVHETAVASASGANLRLAWRTTSIIAGARTVERTVGTRLATWNLAEAVAARARASAIGATSHAGLARPTDAIATWAAPAVDRAGHAVFRGRAHRVATEKR